MFNFNLAMFNFYLFLFDIDFFVTMCVYIYIGTYVPASVYSAVCLKVDVSDFGS